MEIKFYKGYHTIGRDIHQVFVYIDEAWDSQGKYKTCYAPIGQHGAIDPSYLDDCCEITREEYIKESQGLYTPEEYLTGGDTK